jgi:hypothetical protein
MWHEEKSPQTHKIINKIYRRYLVRMRTSLSRLGRGMLAGTRTSGRHWHWPAGACGATATILSSRELPLQCRWLFVESLQRLSCRAWLAFKGCPAQVDWCRYHDRVLSGLCCSGCLVSASPLLAHVPNTLYSTLSGSLFMNPVLSWCFLENT